MSSIPSDINNADFGKTLREELVQTAVKFLQNQSVINTPLAQKQKFLQRKGLSDLEVQEACERSGAYNVHEQVPLQPPAVRSFFPMYRQTQTSWFAQLKEIVHTTALFSAIVYAVYMFYQKFIRPFLFGGKKKKAVEDSIDDLEKSVKSAVSDLRDGLDTVKVEVDKINENSRTTRQLAELKSEISSIKGLLLSRKQFPPVSSNSPVVPPSIPAWQLASVPPDTDADQDPKAEELLEIGSGSGSSEPEHTTKNSDSSLEIIYSFKHDSKDDGSSENYDKQICGEDC